MYTIGKDKYGEQKRATLDKIKYSLDELKECVGHPPLDKSFNELSDEEVDILNELLDNDKYEEYDDMRFRLSEISAERYNDKFNDFCKLRYRCNFYDCVQFLSLDAPFKSYTGSNWGYRADYHRAMAGHYKDLVERPYTHDMEGNPLPEYSIPYHIMVMRWEKGLSIRDTFYLPPGIDEAEKRALELVSTPITSIKGDDIQAIYYHYDTGMVDVLCPAYLDKEGQTVSVEDFLAGNVKRTFSKIGYTGIANNGLRFTYIDEFCDGCHDQARVRFEDGEETVIPWNTYSLYSLKNHVTMVHPTLTCHKRGQYHGFTTKALACWIGDTRPYECECQVCGLKDVLTPQQMIEHANIHNEVRSVIKE